jgi:hypothetical protein
MFICQISPTTQGSLEKTKRIKETFDKFLYGILLSKLFCPTVRKNCSNVRENFLEFKAEGREFAKFLRSLKQFFRAVKGQNNF